MAIADFSDVTLVSDDTDGLDDPDDPEYPDDHDESFPVIKFMYLAERSYIIIKVI